MALQYEETKKQTEFKNFAFISYSHADMAWGKRIQSQLERYRLPARLQKKYKDTPVRAFPIARDDTDIAGAKVWSAITKELDESQFLIVICSPNSAKSDWVNDEIRHFIETGKEDKILPLIIGGVPNSGDPATECFPSALREMKDAPLGVDVQALGWRKARLRMVASLLKVDFDELLRRDTHRRIRNGILAGILAAILGSALGCWIWYNTEHSKYYNAYTYQHEIPVGICELTETERKAMSDCYRITTRQNKVIRLETVNSFGTVAFEAFSTSTMGYPVQEFLYDDNGDLVSVILKDVTGMEVSRKLLTSNKDTNEIAIDFRSPSNSLNAQALSSDMSTYLVGDSGTGRKSEITRQRNVYDEDGYLIKTLYQRDSLGTPACDSNGVYGKAYTYNDQGLISSSSNLNESGEVFNCKYGWAYEIFTYDEKGNEILSEYYNADGEKVRGKSGYAATRVVYDANGNAVRWEALDEFGDITYCADGFAMELIEYESNGMKCSTKYYDAEETPTHDSNGVHEIEYTYDDRGRCISMSFYDTKGDGVYSSNLGYASVRYSPDEHGRLTEERYYDALGNPCCIKESGAYGVRYAYNDNGYHIRTDCLNAEGNIATSKFGYAMWCVQRDEDGRILKEEYRDERGKLTRSQDGIAVLEYAYDTFGNVIELRFYDENGFLCRLKDGHAIIQRTYESGNLVSERVYGPDGKPMLGKEYYFESRWEYDERGNCIRRSHYDTEGNPIDGSFDYSAYTNQYDIYGNITEECYFMADGQPAYTHDYYQRNFEYDSFGNQILYVEESARYVENEYDVFGNVIEKRYFDANGNPPSPDKFQAQEKLEYDRQGNLLRHEYIYGTEEPYSIILCMTYDERSNVILEERFYQEYAAEAVCSNQVRYTYDDYSNCIRTEYLDGNGAPRTLEEGYASFAQGFTPEGNVKWWECYDENGKPCLYAGQTFRFEYEYDTFGRETEMRLYDMNGKLHKEETGLAAIVRYEDDIRGILTYKGRFNEHGQPFGTEDDPLSYTEYVVDAAGFQEEERYFDKNGKMLGEKHFYAYAGEVYEGKSAFEQGVQPGQFIIQLGDWNYYETYEFSSQSTLRAEVARTISTEKELILCEWTAENTFIFRRFHMPEGQMGIRIMSDVGDAQVLERMQTAYFEWQASQK